MSVSLLSVLLCDCVLCFVFVQPEVSIVICRNCTDWNWMVLHETCVKSTRQAVCHWSPYDSSIAELGAGRMGRNDSRRTGLVELYILLLIALCV